MVDATVLNIGVVMFLAMHCLPTLSVPRARLSDGSPWRLQHGRRWPVFLASVVPALVVTPIWMLSPLFYLGVGMLHPGRPCGADHPEWLHVGLMYGSLGFMVAVPVLLPTWGLLLIAWARTRWTELRVDGSQLVIRRPWPAAPEHLPVGELEASCDAAGRLKLRTDSVALSWPVPRTEAQAMERLCTELTAAKRLGEPQHD